MLFAFLVPQPISANILDDIQYEIVDAAKSLKTLRIVDEGHIQVVDSVTRDGDCAWDVVINDSWLIDGGRFAKTASYGRVNQAHS